MRIRLTAKITVLIILVLIVGFGVATVLTIKRESELLVEQNKMAARQLIGTLVSSIETAMLQSGPTSPAASSTTCANSKLVQGLVVYRRNGVEAFTDLATLREVSKEAELPKDVMASIEKMRARAGPDDDGAALHPGARDAADAGGARVRATAPPCSRCTSRSPTRSSCQGCHGADHKVRAVVQAATSHGAGDGRGAHAAQPADHDRPPDHRGRGRGAGGGHALRGGAADPRAGRRWPGASARATSRRGRRAGARRRDGRAGRRPQRHDAAISRAPGTSWPPATPSWPPRSRTCRPRAQRLELLEQLKGELSKFVPDAVKDLLERNPNATELEKRNEEVSVLFLDIAGYTKLSEQLEAKRLNQLVQTYFSSFLEIIRAPPRRRERDRGRRAHGDLPEAAARARRGRRGPRAQRHPRRLRDPPEDDRAERGVRRRASRPSRCTWGSTPARRWWAPPSWAGPASSAGRSPPPAPPPTRGALRGLRAEGGDIVVGPLTAERIRRALRAGIARRAQLQERLPADPDLPRDPARRVQQSHLSATSRRRPLRPSSRTRSR